MIGRLESTMQNIADVFVEEREAQLSHVRTERTFVTYNWRHKTISPAKKAFQPGGSLNETPEKSFYDLMTAHRELLAEYCQFRLPRERSLEDVLRTIRPSSPLPSGVGAALCAHRPETSRGQLSEGAELCLELAEGSFEKIYVEGSLRVIAKQPLGQIRFSKTGGRCELKNVRVKNRGVDWSRSSPFWRARFLRHESAEIILEGHSEFIAENVNLEGAARFVVKDGERLRLTPSQRGIQIEQTQL